MTPRLSGHFSIFRFAFLCAQVYSGNCQTMEYIERGLFATTIFGEIRRCNIQLRYCFDWCSIVLTFTSHMSLLISRSEDRRTGMITKEFPVDKKNLKLSTRRSKHNFWINFYSNCLFSDSKLTTTMLLGSFLNHRELAYCNGRPSWFHIPRGWASGVETKTAAILSVRLELWAGKEGKQSGKPTALNQKLAFNSHRNSSIVKCAGYNYYNKEINVVSLKPYLSKTDIN